MQFTKFGQTGLTVSRMILGTGTFGKQTDEKEAHRMLDKAAEAGINFIDTAEVVPLTVLIIFIILYTMFRSAKWALLILGVVAMAPLGGLLALYSALHQCPTCGIDARARAAGY